jgi:hypothetical protein
MKHLNSDVNISTPTLVTFSLLALLNTGCLSDTKPKGSSVASAPLSLASVPALTQVDGSQLTVSDITIAQYADPKRGGTTVPLLDFRYSPSADYGEAQLCESENRDCKETKTLIESKSVLPIMPDGATVFLKVRACVKPERSTSSKNCGSWVEKQYTQWVVSDPRKRQIEEEKEQVERAIKDYEKSLLDLAKLKADRAAKCKPASEGAKQLIEAERGFAESIAKLGGSIIGAIADRAAKAAPATPAKVTPTTAPEVKPEDKSPDALKPAAVALTSSSEHDLELLELTGDSKVNLIVPQDAKYYSTIVKVMGESIALRAQALRTLTKASSLHTDGALNVASSNPADSLSGTTGSLGGGDGKPADKPPTVDPAKVEPSTKKDENLGKELVKTTPATGTKLDLAPLINVLPDIAGAMFDLGNAERWVAANVGVCVSGFDQKQENALQFAQAAAESQKELLKTRVEQLAAALKAGGP